MTIKHPELKEHSSLSPAILHTRGHSCPVHSSNDRLLIQFAHAATCQLCMFLAKRQCREVNGYIGYIAKGTRYLNAL